MPLYALSPIPLGMPLMVAQLEAKLRRFSIRESDYVAVYSVAGYPINRSLQTVRDLGGKPMLALNPGTSAEVLRYLTAAVKGVLVMAVTPALRSKVHPCDSRENHRCAAYAGCGRSAGRGG